MNSKQLKFYQLFTQMSRKSDLTTNPASIANSFSSFLMLDYNLSQDAWEFLATSHDALMQSSLDCATNIGQVILELFYAKSQSRCIKTIYDIPAIRYAVYEYNPNCESGVAFNILVETLLTNKFKESDELLRCLVKNPNIDFGALLKDTIERLFIETLKKSASKKIELNKKLTTLLLNYISKIKTDDRALLEQRIKEIL